MVDQSTFIEAVRSVQEILRTRTEPATKEEIQSYFKKMDLSQEQQELVCQYLQNSQEAFGEGASGKSQADAEEPRSPGVKGKKEPRPNIHNRLYRDEVAATPVLSQEQKAELYRRLLAGEQAAVAAISSQWLGKLLEIAGAYASDQMLLEELVQEGNLGLLTGLGHFLGKEGEEEPAAVEVRLEAYAREAMEGFCQQEESMEYQEKLLLAKVNFIHEAQRLLAEENFTVPTIQELADYTRMPEEEVRAILSLFQEK